ncbi:MAG: hypothetical protein IBJ10_05515 [Phycisphaerales bacterium]|nr:hypothetical protein [Phycisphaerales bacterium]
MHTIENKELLRALQVLEQTDQDSPQRNRRIFRRFSTRVAATLAIDPQCASGPSTRPFAVEIRDASRGGFGLLCPSGVELNRIYRLVGVREGIELFSTPVVARHARHVTGGVWLVGTICVAEASTLHALGVGLQELRASEQGVDFAQGDFLPVEEAA